MRKAGRENEMLNAKICFDIGGRRRMKTFLHRGGK
jgi:hypothetical protein